MTKRLYADQSAMTRLEALAHERTRPYGLPSDRVKRQQQR
jgi:hypothetical protein